MNDDFNRPVAYAYIRLSQDDMKAAGPIEEKFEIRSRIAQSLAERHALILPPENIVVEQRSGGKLQTREGALRLLAMAKRGQLKHLITPYIDRLLRGDKRDEQDIEDALCIGGVFVYHTESDHPIHFGPDYDPTLFEIKAFVARTELRGTIRKKRETNLARLRMGKRSGSYAPYGYRYLSAVYDAYRRLITPASHVTEPEEFAYVQEIFTRIRTESIYAICADFNARGVPPVRAGRDLPNAAVMWNASTVSSMVKNPFYAGYINQRKRIVRGQTFNLKASEYLLSDVPGDWPAVVTIDEWREIQEIVASRSNGGNAPKVGLLSGTLHNGVCGFGMNRSGTFYYTCDCARWDRNPAAGRAKHRAMSIHCSKVDPWARDLIAATLRVLPPSMVDAKTSKRGKGATPINTSSITAARVSLSALGRDLAEARRKAEDLMLRRSYYVDSFGEPSFKAAVDKTSAELKKLQAEEIRLRAEVAQPDLNQTLPVLARLRKELIDGGDDAAFWADLKPASAADLVQALVKDIILNPDIEAGGKRGENGYPWIPEVIFWPWVYTVCDPPSPPPIPKRITRD